MTNRNLLLCLLGLLLCLPTLGGGWWAQAQKPLDPSWVPYRDWDRRSDSSEPREAEVLELPRSVTVRLGDPRLGQWAAVQSKSLSKLSKREVLAWLRVCELYRVTEAESAIMSAVARLDPVTDDEFSRRLYAAVPMVATAKSKDKLKKMLEALEDVPIGIDEETRFRHVARIAAVLVRMNDDAGRDFLLDYLKKGLLTVGNSMDAQLDAVSEELAWIGDDKLYKIIEQLAKEPAFEKNKRFMEELLELMDRNRKSVTTLWKEFDDTDNRGRDLHPLLIMLAERDGLDGLKKLAVAEPRHRERASKSSKERELERFMQVRNGAVLAMQCRLWRELLDK